MLHQHGVRGGASRQVISFPYLSTSTSHITFLSRCLVSYFRFVSPSLSAGMQAHPYVYRGEGEGWLLGLYREIFTPWLPFMNLINPCLPYYLHMHIRVCLFDKDKSVFNEKVAKSEVWTIQRGTCRKYRQRQQSSWLWLISRKFWCSISDILRDSFLLTHTQYVSLTMENF